MNTKLISTNYKNARTVIGKWYFCSYWNKWDKILGITSTGEWEVVDTHGRCRHHRTPLRAIGLSPVLLEGAFPSINATLEACKTARLNCGWTF